MLIIDPGIYSNHLKSPRPLSPQHHIVPLEYQTVDTSIDGSQGDWRSTAKRPRAMKATNDLEAIREWLDHHRDKHISTWRSYRKEAERLLAWAIVEKGKAVSSLDVEDLEHYRYFLTMPASKHPKIVWVARQKSGEKKRYRRDDPNWRPFDGPLSPSSVNYALRVLKSMFSFWYELGYTYYNPLTSNKDAIYVKNTDAIIKARSLDLDSWTYLYQFIELNTVNIPSQLNAIERLRWQRYWYRAEVIFASLYLLGLKINELTGIKMKNFIQTDRKDSKVISNFNNSNHYWLNIISNNKQRKIPVPNDLIEVIKRYRNFLNKQENTNRKIPLPEAPNIHDKSAVILNSTGRQAITTNRLQVIVKEVITEALAYYDNYVEYCSEQSIRPLSINKTAFEKASSNWLRHTSACHQGLRGISLRYIQQSLGHSSLDTTTLYDYSDNNDWHNNINLMTLRK